MDGGEVCELLYRDDYLVAVNKPAGLLVHRSPIDRHETRFALQQVRDQLGQHVYPVHRLDKPTSGVLLFALSSEVARLLSTQFANGAVRKEYLAVVRGFCPSEGTIDYPLKRELDRIADRDRCLDKAAQSALTRFARLGIVELPIAVERYPQTRYSLVQLWPHSGRKHQLRRHMKHIGYPIIGDAKHGKGVHNRFFQRAYDCRRLLLACTGVALTHPVSGAQVSVQATLDTAFDMVLVALGWDNCVPQALRHGAGTLATEA